MAAHAFTSGFYAKVAAASFVLGACMEAFMIRTGFYETVTELEGARLAESREEREAFMARLKDEHERRRRGGGGGVEERPRRGGGGGGGGGGGSGTT